MKCCAKFVAMFMVLNCLNIFISAARGGTPVGLSATHAGHVNFTGTAGSLRRDSNLGDACAVDNYDTAPLNGLPAGATIRAAYLYWAGSYADRRRSTQRSPDWSVTFEGQSVSADRQFTESYGNGRNRYDFFSGRADVTALVAAKGNGLYTFGNLEVNTGRPHCRVQAVLAGWSLIVVYEHASESNRVVNVFDGFEVYRGGQISVTANNFQIAATDINGKVAHLTWEGDAENSGALNGFNEGLIFNGNDLLDNLNPVRNQFNSTVNINGSSDQWGVDLDIYDVTPFLNAGDTAATTVYRSGQDLVLLSAEIVSVTNIALTDLGFVAVPDDPLGVYEVGNIRLDLVNYGPSDELLPVAIAATLPVGLDYVGTTSSGWGIDLSNLPTVRWTHPGPVSAGQALPLVFTVRPTPLVLGVTTLAVNVTGSSFDFNLANNSGSVPLTVVLPPAELAASSFTNTVSDPVNGTTNPKAIPGAIMVVSVSTSNLKAGTVDRNSVEVSTAVPPQMMMYVNDFPGTSDGPVLLVEGKPASSLTLGRGPFGNGRTAIFYSNDGGQSYGYKPVPDALGFDAAVTHLRAELSGIFRGRDASGPSSFTLKYQAMLR